MTHSIVYVHGALSTKRSFEYIAERLPRATLHSSPIVEQAFFSYDIKAEPANDSAARLAKLIKSVKSNDEVTLIAHSYGGVLSVEAARLLATVRPLKVISMSTPYGGSSIASFLKVLKPASTMFDNIGRYNSFMREFSAKSLPCRVRGLVTVAGSAEWIAEDNDGVVSVASQRHFAADPNWSGADVALNHFEVLLSPIVVGLIGKELSTKPKRKVTQ